jgi:hypothetical protein
MYTGILVMVTDQYRSTTVSKHKEIKHHLTQTVYSVQDNMSKHSIHQCTLQMHILIELHTCVMFHVKSTVIRVQILGFLGKSICTNTNTL